MRGRCTRTRDRLAAPIDREEPCELCGSRQGEIVGEKDRQGAALTTVLCIRCGLIAHANVPTDAEVAAFYTAPYRQTYQGQTAPAPHRIVRAWRQGRQIHARLRPHLKPDDRVLEIGAGLGCTVKAFELAGHDARGIEPGASFQEFSDRALEANVKRAMLEELPDQRCCDVVLLVHVIEHFNHPLRALRKIRNLLWQDGLLYVECPNAGAPHARPGQLFHTAHIYNFTQQTLLMMARAAGFEPVASYFQPHEPVLRMLFIASNRPRLVVDPHSYWQTSQALRRFNGLTYHLRWRYLVRRVQRGISLLSDRLFAGYRVARLARGCRHSRSTEFIPLGRTGSSLLTPPSESVLTR